MGVADLRNCLLLLFTNLFFLLNFFVQVTYYNFRSGSMVTVVFRIFNSK